jgi:hypothetical protein
VLVNVALVATFQVLLYDSHSFHNSFFSNIKPRRCSQAQVPYARGLSACIGCKWGGNLAPVHRGPTRANSSEHQQTQS